MAKKIIFLARVLDEHDKFLSDEILSSKDIIKPTDTSNFGFNQQEQLLLMSQMQQKLLNEQVAFLKSAVGDLSVMP